MEKATRRAREHPAVLLAAGAMALSGALLLHWFSRITFWRDEWGFLLHRRGWSVGTFLDPAGEHLSAPPILIYKLLLEATGMNSPRPYQVVAVLVFLLSVALLFVYVRGRAGKWLALAGVLPILFLGPSWTDLLFPYQIAFFGSKACGLAALLCLDRRTRGWDIAATVLLCAGLLSPMRASRSWRALRSKSGLAATGSSGPTSSPCRPCSGSSGTSAGGTPPTPSYR